jgi:cold-inducible RNA-binding protein
MYVGNLDFTATDEDLRTAFAAFGAVASANVSKDGTTGYPRGYGFVEMRDAVAAKAAIAGLDGTQLCGRQLMVNPVREGQ